MKNISAAFFTEAGCLRGMGHLIRSFSIAKKFKSLGFETSLFLDSDVNFNDKFKDVSYFNWTSFELIDNYDIIFIDSYEADISIYHKIANACKVAVYIDDFKRLDYPKGVILNFAPDADKVFYKIKEDKHIYLLGLNYIPIRDDFLMIKASKKEHIFIILGGSDIANLSLTMIEALKEITIKKVIISNNAETKKALKNYKNVEVLSQPSDTQLAKAMVNSIMAISTASMSAYELSYFRIPTIIIAVAQNQETGVLQFMKNGIVNDYVSIKNEAWQDNIKNKVERILYQGKKKSGQIIDGNGTKNIVQETLELIK